MSIYRTEVNWDNFKQIFSNNPQAAFENLSYQLFCYEYKQKYGIYRYYNQPYIETMPIQVETDTIGFQAKFYDASTNLSSKKTELISSIKSAHIKYPDLNKIIFYINKEPGISTEKNKQKPAYIQEIEKAAQDRNIEIIWRGPSYFEKMLLNSDLERIMDYFFNTNGGIRKFIEQVEVHSKSIFDSINSDITFNSTTIKISRPKYDLENFFESPKRILIVHGEGGSGKSGYIKDTFSNIKDIPVFIFKSTDFECATLSEIARKFGDCNFKEFLCTFNTSQRKICILDSAEKVFNMKYQDAFIAFINMLIEYNWYVVFTIRTQYKDNLINSIIHCSEYVDCPITKLTSDELNNIANDNHFPLPENLKLLDFLCNLFYLKLYLSNTDNMLCENISAFLNKIWNEIICNHSVSKNSIDVKRNKAIKELVLSNLSNGVTYYSVDLIKDWDAIEALTEDEIISFDQTMDGYYITHDVYEEIVLKNILTTKYKSKTSNEEFFDYIGNSLTMRKAFRLWLHDEIIENDFAIFSFVKQILSSDTIENIWRDEILIAILNESETDTFDAFEEILSDNNYFYLDRALFLLNTACKIIDTELLSLFASTNQLVNTYRLTMPNDGNGWSFVISFANKHKDNIPWNLMLIMHTIDVIDSWARKHTRGKTTHNAGVLALYIYNWILDSDLRYILRNEKEKQISLTILKCSYEIVDELTECFNTIIHSENPFRKSRYMNLCQYALSDIMNGDRIYQATPNLIIELCSKVWKKTEIDYPFGFMGCTSIDLSENFGLTSDFDQAYTPASALKTPILWLLKYYPQRTIDFIIDLVNYATNVYEKSQSNTEYCETYHINIIFDEGESVTQICSDRLWKMHRGTSVGPKILESILMALEKWLYEYINIKDENAATNICLYLLKKSTSACITSIIVGMVEAYPDKLFRIACILLHTKEIFHLDIARLINESQANIYFPGYDQFCVNERKTANALEHRKKQLRDIYLGYQLFSNNLTQEEFSDRMHILHKYFDKAFQNIDELPLMEQKILYRIDIRKNQLNTENVDGNTLIAISPNLPEHIAKDQEACEEKSRISGIFSSILGWTLAHLKKDTDSYTLYSIYEDNPYTALEDVITLIESSDLVRDIGMVTSVAATILIDFEDKMKADDLQDCIYVIYNHFKRVLPHRLNCSTLDGTEAAIASIPVLMKHYPNLYKISLGNPVIILLGILLEYSNDRQFAIKAFAEIMEAYPDISKKIISAYVQLCPLYDKEVCIYNGISIMQFYFKYKHILKDIFNNQNNQPYDLSHLDANRSQSLCLLVPFNCSLANYLAINTASNIWSTLFCRDTYSRNEKVKRHFEQEYSYIVWLANHLISLDENHDCIIKNLLPQLQICRNTYLLLFNIISAQNNQKKTPVFWLIWDQFFNIIETFAKTNANYYIDDAFQINSDRFTELDEIIATYLLAHSGWGENTHSWHTLPENKLGLYLKAATHFGNHPCVLFSISYVYNTIAYNYPDKGLECMYQTIINNPELRKTILKINTEYHLEEFMNRYINSKKKEIRVQPELRKKIMTILDFLVDRGSTCAFMLRDNLS